MFRLLLPAATMNLRPRLFSGCGMVFTIFPFAYPSVICRKPALPYSASAQTDAV
jgi:hypothetical protein